MKLHNSTCCEMKNSVIELATDKEIIPAFETNNVPVCFFSDNKYVPYLGTAVCSAINNANRTTNLDILIFQNGYSEDNKMKLASLAGNKKNISIRFIDMKGFIDQLSVNPSKRVSVNCFAKIFCTDTIFRKYERIIVLDSDLLILQDLLELYHFDMKGKMIAAAREIYILIMAKNGYHTDERLNYMLLRDYLNELGLEPDNYFNTGVLLFDIKKCQEDEVQKKMIEINTKFPTMMYAAQDDFNILFKNRWAELQPKWNVQNPYSLLSCADQFPKEYRQLLNHSGILHFLGKSKPWNDKKVWKRELFDEYAEKTPWSDEYLKRRRQYIRKNFKELYIFPKGSRRREWYLKLYYKMREKK